MTLVRCWLALLVSLIASSARADQLRSTLGQPLREISHTVDVTIVDGIATYKVRRVFANPSKVADEAGLVIKLPYGAAATGLRIRARDRWYDAELLEAELAQKRYHELTGIGRFAPKDPALLSWMWSDQLYLQLFPVLPGSTSTVEYTLTVPTDYSRGRIFLSYPRTGAGEEEEEDSEQTADDELPLAAPVVTLRPSWGDATTQVLIDGQRAAPDTPLVLPTELTLSPWAAEEDSTGSAGYGASTIDVEANQRTATVFSEVHVKVDIEHTYRSDLQVALITPQGERLDVLSDEKVAGDGGSNDVRGDYKIALPKGTQTAGKWHLVVSDHARLDAGRLAQWSLRFGEGAKALAFESLDTPVFIPDAPDSENSAGSASFELAAAPITTLNARLGSVTASTGHAFSRLEIDMAAELQPLPKKAQLVFVVDASHSQGSEGIDAQLAIASAYLSHVPDAEVELVLYRRFAQQLFQGFIPVSTFEQRLAQARQQGLLAPGNGSHLDHGAQLASKLLATRKGPLRMVITTDLLLRPSFLTKHGLAALTQLPTRAIVHVVNYGLYETNWASMSRADNELLGPLATKHHGIYAWIEGSNDGHSKQLRSELLGLVRPTTIDNVVVSGFESKWNGTDADSVLYEGRGERVMLAVESAPEAITIRGKIWSDPYRRVVHAKTRFSRATAGWVFSEDEHGELTDAEMMRVAKMGRAVSPVTSYLAIEPGVRPSPIGLPEMESGSGYVSGSGSGYGRGSGGFHSKDRVPPNLMALVANEAARCIALHKPAADWSLTLSIDTTYREIVDVQPTTRATALHTCLLEAVWATQLNERFIQERDHFDLMFRP